MEQSSWQNFWAWLTVGLNFNWEPPNHSFGKSCWRWAFTLTVAWNFPNGNPNIPVNAMCVSSFCIWVCHASKNTKEKSRQKFVSFLSSSYCILPSSCLVQSLRINTVELIVEISLSCFCWALICYIYLFGISGEESVYCHVLPNK